MARGFEAKVHGHHKNDPGGRLVCLLRVWFWGLGLGFRARGIEVSGFRV